MKNCWSFLLSLCLLSSQVIAGGNHHNDENGIAEILAAGLIIKLLTNRGHHGHEGRDAGSEVHSEHSPYANHDPYAQELRTMTPEGTLSSSSWAQRAPINIAYSHSQYHQPRYTQQHFNHPQQHPYPHHQQFTHSQQPYSQYEQSRDPYYNYAYPSTSQYSYLRYQ